MGFSAEYYSVYYRKQGAGTWTFLDSIASTNLSITGTLFEPNTIYEWRVDAFYPDYQEFATGTTWTIVTDGRGFPKGRHSSYLPENYGWDEDNEAWSSEAEFVDAGGGRYKQTFIAVSDGKIYFEGY